MRSERYVAGLAYARTDETTGGRVVIAGDAPVGVGSVVAASDGTITASGTQLLDVAPNLQAEVLGAIAGSPTLIDTGATDPDIVGAGSVAIGMPNESGGGVIVLVSANDEVRLQATLPARRFPRSELGTALAFVDSDVSDVNVNATETPDLVAAALNQIVLFPDVLRAPAGERPGPRACAVDRERVHRLVVGDFATATAGDEIVAMVGDSELVPNAAAPQPSELYIVPGSWVRTAPDATNGRCGGPAAAPFVLNAPGEELDFGVGLAVGDFDDSGSPDLAVSAPSAGRVYVYLDLTAIPGGMSPAPDVTLIAPATAGSFGAVLSAGDLNGKGAELLVGAPTTDVDGAVDAGSAFLYEYVEASNDFALVQTLHDADPQDNQAFGGSVLISSFGNGDNMISVGAKDELFTYFATLLEGDEDLRQ